MKIEQIPLDELEKDKQESLEDIIICEKAIRHNVKYSGGSIQDRLDTNKRILKKINKELSRRICDTAPYPSCNGANGCDTCEHSEEKR